MLNTVTHIIATSLCLNSSYTGANPDEGDDDVQSDVMVDEDDDDDDIVPQKASKAPSKPTKTVKIADDVRVDVLVIILPRIAG